MARDAPAVNEATHLWFFLEVVFIDCCVWLRFAAA
jgi:hypothetical protein